MERSAGSLGAGGVGSRIVGRSEVIRARYRAAVVCIERAVDRQVAVRAETEIVAGGIGNRFLLARQKCGIGGIESVVIEETVHVKTFDRVRRTDIEKLRGRTALFIGSVDRTRSAALRISHRQSWHVGKQRAPSDAETVSVTV